MKLLQKIAIVSCLLTSLTAIAQEQRNDDQTKIPSQKTEKKTEALKSEKKKNEYKSKQWQQGDEIVPEEKKGTIIKPKTGIEKKPMTPNRVPPPPPAPPRPANRGKA